MHTKTLTITVEDSIKIPITGLPPLLERRINERLVFTNPDYEFRHNRGEWIGSIAPQINCIRKTSGQLWLPRGFLDQLLEICKRINQPYRLVDRRRLLDLVPLEFHGQLKEYQQEAAEAVLERDFATLVGGPKSGKTIVALYTIAQRRQPTLVLIPNLALLDGWLTKIENFLQIPAADVGVLVNGNKRLGKLITVAHTGEVVRNWRQLRDHVGSVILDECQRCPSRIFTQLITNFDSRYMLGLTTSAERRDRLSRLIYYYLGDIAYTINEKDAREGRGIIQAQVVARTTEFQYPYNSRADYEPMLHSLVSDNQRTELIIDDIEREIREQTQPVLVLSAGEEQNGVLERELRRRGIEVMVYGQAAEANEEEGMDELDELAPGPLPPSASGPMVILLAPQTLMRYSRSLASKVLFLAVPLYFRGRLAYAIRNLYCSANGNGASRLKIYDYVDQNVALFENYFRMRSYNYGIHPDVLINAN
jgi:hypothetical protein